MEWKFDIFSQLQKTKHQSDVYEEIITHYNRLLEKNTSLQVRCSRLDEHVQQLRLSNVGLERASQASQEVANVNNQLTIANEEVIMHLREKGELAKEILRLNRTLNETQEKLTETESKLQRITTEKEKLAGKVEQLELENTTISQTNEILRDEFIALRTQFDQLQIEYSQMKPTCLELTQQLEQERRLVEEREVELMNCKKLQLDLLNAEVERYNKRLEQRKTSDASIRSLPVKEPSDDSTSEISSSSDNRRMTISGTSATQPSTTTGNNFFSSVKKLFDPRSSTETSTKIDLTVTQCFAASVPTREAYRWDCTELEIYSMQFQPCGSLLATGCSDRQVHVWSVSSTGHAYRQFSLRCGNGAINALDFDNERAGLLAGAAGEIAYVWMYTDQRVLKDTFTGHHGLINSCKFKSARSLVTGSSDRTIKTWDLQTRQCIRTLIFGSKCHDLLIMDSLGTIVSGHFDKKIRIWDPLTDRCSKEYLCKASVTSLAYNRENHQLLACTKEDSIELIDMRQYKMIYSLCDENFQSGTDTHKAILSPDGRYVCSGSHDGSVIIWNTENGKVENVLKKKHKTMVTAVAWQPDGKLLASSEKQRQVIIWSD